MKKNLKCFLHGHDWQGLMVGGGVLTMHAHKGAECKTCGETLHADLHFHHTRCDWRDNSGVLPDLPTCLLLIVIPAYVIGILLFS